MHTSEYQLPCREVYSISSQKSKMKLFSLVKNLFRFRVITLNFSRKESILKCSNICKTHCLKSVQIRIFWSVFFCFRTEHGDLRTRKNSLFGYFLRSDPESCWCDWWHIPFHLTSNFRKPTWLLFISDISSIDKLPWDTICRAYFPQSIHYSKVPRQTELHQIANKNEILLQSKVNVMSIKWVQYHLEMR